MFVNFVLNYLNGLGFKHMFCLINFNFPYNRHCHSY